MLWMSLTSRKAWRVKISGPVRLEESPIEVAEADRLTARLIRGYFLEGISKPETKAFYIVTGCKWNPTDVPVNRWTTPEYSSRQAPFIFEGLTTSLLEFRTKHSFENHLS